MQQARRHPTRRRPRPIRVVSLDAVKAAIFIDEPERTALRVGLTFAAHLRRLFPEFYQSYVQQLRTRIDTLLGITGAFLSLAHTQLLALDLDANAITPGGYGGWYTARMPFAPKNPRNALTPLHGIDTSLRLLVNEGSAWLGQPVPKVYGIGVDEVTRGDHGYAYGLGRTIGRHALTLAIWRLLGGTPWVSLPANRVSELAAERCKDDQLGQTIAVLPTLPADTPLAPLCAWLDRTQPAKIRQLGTLVAYVCQRTGNGFADVTPTEARQQYETVIDLGWSLPVEGFAPARQEQQAAASWARAFSRLSGRFQRERDLAAQIRTAILEAAAAVAGSDRSFAVYDPRALIWRMP